MSLFSDLNWLEISWVWCTVLLCFELMCDITNYTLDWLYRTYKFWSWALHHFHPRNYFRMWFCLESIFLPRYQRITVRYLGQKLKINCHTYYFNRYGVSVRENKHPHRLQHWECSLLRWRLGPVFTLTYLNCYRYSYYLLTISFR